MSMSYDTALIATTDVPTLTGMQNLANLTTTGELNLTNFVLEAHRAIYRRLEAAGVNPTVLTNETRLRAAEAWETVRLLAISGYALKKTQDQSEVVKLYTDQVDREMLNFRPHYSDGSDEPRTGLEGVPALANFEDGWMYGPLVPTPIAQPYAHGYPQPG